MVPAGFDLAAVISATPLSLKKVRMEARRDRWRDYCTDCGSDIGAEVALSHSSMWDEPDDEFLCKACVADRVDAGLYPGEDFYPDDFEYCCLHDAWDEYECRLQAQKQFWEGQI